MRGILTKGQLFLFVFVFSSVLSGCATTPKVPIKLDPQFSSKNIESIVLMPIVDRRIGEKTGIDLEKELRNPIKGMLEKKGYEVIMPEKFSAKHEFKPEDVAEMDASDLSDLGPDDSRALMFIYVEDVASNYSVIAYTFRIETTGSLIEKNDRIELWRDKGIGASGQGGLASGLFAGMDRSVAMTTALDSLLSSLPNSANAPSKKNNNKKSSNKLVDKDVMNATPPVQPIAI